LKRKITISITVVIIIIFAFGFYLRQKEISMELYEELVNEEKEAIKNFLDQPYFDNIVDIQSVGYYHLVLTEAGNIHILRRYDINNEEFIYEEFPKDEAINDEKIIDIHCNAYSRNNCSAITESNNVILLNFSRFNYEELYPNSGWVNYSKTKDTIWKDEDYYYNYLLFPSSIVDNQKVEFFGIIESFDSDSEERYLIYQLENNLEMYAIDKNYISINPSQIKNVVPVEFDNNVKKVTTSGYETRRVNVLTSDGYLYGFGVYGAFDYSILATIHNIGNRNEFVKLDIGDIQGKVTKIESTLLYDLVFTEDSVYFYGVLPTELDSWGSEKQQITFKELKYNGKSVIPVAAAGKGLLNSTVVDNKNNIFHLSKNGHFTLDSEVVKDELNLVDYSLVGIDESEYDFEKSLSTNSNFLFKNTGEIYFYYFDMNNKRKFTPVEVVLPTSYLTYNDYLDQRKQEYIDNIDQSIIDEYYESIKYTLPKGNIKN